MSVYDYTSSHQDIIYFALLVCSGLSILGCGFIICLFSCYSNLRKLPFRLIFYLTIADLGTSIAFTLPYMNSDIFCQVQGGAISYFSLSSVLWSGCICHAIKVTIVQGCEIKPYEKNYLIIGFLLPLLVFLVLIDIHKYDVALGWCWIYQSQYITSLYYRQIAYRLITFYVPLFLVLSYIVYQYFRIVTVIKNSDIYDSTNRNIGESMILKLKLYPIILFLSQLPVIVIRFMSFSITPPWYMVLIAGVGAASMGFVNSIVYGLTQEIKNELFKNFCKRKDSEMISMAEPDDTNALFSSI